MEPFSLFPLFFLPFFLLIFALSIGGLVFWVWMLIDCATKEVDKNNQKVTWILVIALAGWIGGLIYFFVRRPQRIKETGK